MGRRRAAGRHRSCQVKFSWVILAVGFLAYASTHSAFAQQFPQRPIHIIVGFGPGGGSDIVARILGQFMQEKLGQPVLIDNKPGAAGTIGNEIVARAEKDGYTLGIMTAGQIIAAAMNKSLRYDTIAAFDPVSQVATTSLMIVTLPDYPASNARDLVKLAKTDPGKIVFASAGFGATQHFAAELFMLQAGVKMLHVPYRSSPEAISAVLSKQVSVLFDTVSAVIGHVQSGQLKAIAITGRERFPIVPDVPTVMESSDIAGYDVTSWYGIFTPKGVAPEIIAKLNKTLNEIIAEERVRKLLIASGVVVQGSTPEAFGKLMADELVRWDGVRKAAGIPQQ